MRRPEKIKLKDGTVCWQVRNPDAQGVMRYERFATKRDADAAAVRLESARKTGGVVNEKKTVGETIKEFIAARVESHLRPSAQKDIKAHLARIDQYWGHRLLRTVTPPGIGVNSRTIPTLMLLPLPYWIDTFNDPKTVATLANKKRPSAPVNVTLPA